MIDWINFKDKVPPENKLLIICSRIEGEKISHLQFGYFDQETYKNPKYNKGDKIEHWAYVNYPEEI